MSEVQESITKHTERARGLIRLACRAMSADLALGADGDADIISALHAADDSLGSALTALDDFEPVGSEKAGAPDEDEEFGGNAAGDEGAIVSGGTEELISDIVRAARAQWMETISDTEAKALNYSHWAERLHRAAASIRQKALRDGAYVAWDHRKAAEHLLERLAFESLSQISDGEIAYDGRRQEIWAKTKLRISELIAFEERYVAGIGLDHFPTSATEMFEDLLDKLEKLVKQILKRDAFAVASSVQPPAQGCIGEVEAP